MRLLSVALHEKAEAPALPRGSALQKEPRGAGWLCGRRREGDGEKRRAEKTGLENEAAYTKKPTFQFFDRREQINLEA